MNNIDRISVATPQDVDPIPNSMKRNMDLIPVAIYVRSQATARTSTTPSRPRSTNACVKGGGKVDH